MYKIFTVWVTPVLIMPAFYIGSGACVLWGGYLIATNSYHRVDYPGTIAHQLPIWPNIWLGWAWVLIGPLLLRILCEVIAAIFMLLEAAENAEKQAVQSDAVNYDTAA